MRVLTIEAADNLLAEQPSVKQNLKQLHQISIAEKKATFKADEIAGLPELLSFDLLTERSGPRYEFNFDSLVTCRVLHEVAEEMLAKPVPATIEDALAFGAEFYDLIRQPKVRHTWYFHLAMDFDRYLLVWLDQVKGIDITAYFLQLIADTKSVRLPIPKLHTYRSSFPYLSLSISDTFSTIASLLNDNEVLNSIGTEALSNLAEHNPAKAAECYVYAKSNGGDAIHGIIPLLQIGLFIEDPPEYFQEGLDLFDRLPGEGGMSLAWFKYNDDSHIRTAYDRVTSLPLGSTELMRYYPPFFTRLIENDATPEDIRSECFIQIGLLLDIEDDNLRQQLIWRLSTIEGHDEGKIFLLPKIMAIHPRYIAEIFKRINTPAYYFELVKSIYIALGHQVEFGYFSDAASSLQHNQPEEFETGLLELLTDDLALARLAGLKILSSRYGGLYEVDFLQLDEKHQLRAIDTLLSHPHSVEQLLPMFLGLRKSPFDAVRLKLTKSLKDLIWAYDYHLTEMIKKILDTNDDDDKTLLDDIEREFDNYESIKKQKEAISEFDPILNTADDVDYFRRTEDELRAEGIRKAESNSIMAHFAKNIGVIRGSAFKVEAAGNLTPMHSVGGSILVDIRYYRNPDEYQWNYNLHMTMLNYSDKEAGE